jgi:hypothetical protein
MIGLVAGLLFLGAASCSKRVSSKEIGLDSVISEQLLVAKSLSELEARLHYVQKTEVATEKGGTFVFYEQYPYRGVPSTVVHCYEQVRSNKWILRGYFPVATWNFDKLPNGRHLEFQATSDGSVNLICNSNVLFVITSQAAAER